MRMSCNGCRILRKGCSKDCTIRPCLEWLKNPQHQSNATFFLAKFYGRAGLINLINSGPKNLRPAIFRSLLYEACGRIVDPIYGSAGLLCSGSWELCQAAVESVLKGTPIMQISPGEGGPMMMNGCDIRHVARDEQPDAVQRVKSIRSRFKRSGHPVQQLDSAAAEFARDLGWVGAGGTEPAGESAESMFSDGSNGSGAEEGGELELELRLGIEPVSHAEEEGVHGEGHVKGVGVMDGWGGDTCHVELRLV